MQNEPLMTGDLTTRNRRHAVVLASGGMDAFYALLHYLEKYEDSDTVITLLHFNYGQRACGAERLAVERQAVYLQTVRRVTTHLCFLDDPLAMNLLDHPLTSREIEVRAHMGEDVSGEQLYVPNRNARFMVQAMGLAEVWGASNIIFGAVGNVNLDNSLTFLLRMIQLHDIAGLEKVGIYAPFVLFSKSIVPHYAHVSGTWGNVAKELTVSCFFPQLKSVDSDTDDKFEIRHCGKCRSCQTMQQGIKFACVEDPYLYIERPDPRAKPMRPKDGTVLGRLSDFVVICDEDPVGTASGRVTTDTLPRDHENTPSMVTISTDN